MIVDKPTAHGFITAAPDQSAPAAAGHPADQATLNGSGAIAQGRTAKAAGQGAVIVERANAAPINTSAGSIYQTFIQQAVQPGAGADALRRGYLAWLSLRANELPWFAGDSGRPAQDDTRREALDAGGEVYRVVRGGSWFDHRVGARCAFRFENPPADRADVLGFRVVLRAAPVSSALDSDHSELRHSDLPIPEGVRGSLRV